MEGEVVDMTTNLDSFVFGTDPYPSWFKIYSNQGRVEYLTRENAVYGVKLNNTNSVLEAFIGDIIARLGNNFLVISKETAEKYMKK